MEVVNAINVLTRFRDDEIVTALRDGDPVPSNPLLQNRRDALRRRALGLAARLERLATQAGPTMEAPAQQ